MNEQTERKVVDLAGFGQISRPGQAEYSQVDAAAMQGRMLGCRHDHGVYGKVVGMVGYREQKFAKPIYALEVQWTGKPHQSLSHKATIYRSEVGRHYSVLSGSAEKIAQRVWDYHFGEQQAAQQNRSGGVGR